jgi:hypothetical protein
MSDPHPKPTKTIRTASLDSRTQQLVREAGQGRVRLTVVEDDGRQIAEVRPVSASQPTDLWANYDPEEARHAWRASSGVLRDVDVESLLADLKAEREQDDDLRSAP